MIKEGIYELKQLVRKVYEGNSNPVEAVYTHLVVGKYPNQYEEQEGAPTHFAMLQEGSYPELVPNSLVFTVNLMKLNKEELIVVNTWLFEDHYTEVREGLMAQGVIGESLGYVESGFEKFPVVALNVDQLRFVEGL